MVQFDSGNSLSLSSTLFQRDFRLSVNLFVGRVLRFVVEGPALNVEREYNMLKRIRGRTT